MAGETNSLSWLKYTTSSRVCVCMWLLSSNTIKALNSTVSFRIKFMSVLLKTDFVIVRIAFWYKQLDSVTALIQITQSEAFKWIYHEKDLGIL